MTQRFEGKIAVITGGNSGADAVLYLASHESRFIIGTDLVIDGGRIQL